jgi:hypothetical protein
MKPIGLTFALTLSMFTVAPAAAQSRIVAQGALTSAISGSDTNLAVSGGAGYEWAGLRVSGEVTRTSKLPPNFVHILGAEAWTRVTAFTGNARLTLPIGSGGLSAHVLGGIGTARVTDAFTVVYVLPGPNPITTTYSRAAFTGGGGLGVALNDRVSIEADLRILRITGDRARSIGRVGAGLTVRF